MQLKAVWILQPLSGGVHSLLPSRCSMIVCKQVLVLVRE